MTEYELNNTELHRISIALEHAADCEGGFKGRKQEEDYREMAEKIKSAWKDNESGKATLIPDE